MLTLSENVTYYSRPDDLQFDYAKRDSRPAAYGGVVLQRLEFMKSAHRLVSATSPLRSLHEGTGCRDLFHYQFRRSVQRLRFVLKIQTSLNSWQKWLVYTMRLVSAKC